LVGTIFHTTSVGCRVTRSKLLEERLELGIDEDDAIGRSVLKNRASSCFSES
jgi:hypothetical protein